MRGSHVRTHRTFAGLLAARDSIRASGSAEMVQHFIVSGDHRFDGTDALPALVEALS